MYPRSRLSALVVVIVRRRYLPKMEDSREDFTVVWPASYPVEAPLGDAFGQEQTLWYFCRYVVACIIHLVSSMRRNVGRKEISCTTGSLPPSHECHHIRLIDG